MAQRAALLAGATALRALPDPLPDGAAAEFLAGAPLPALFRQLSLPWESEEELGQVCRALTRAMSSTPGTALLLENPHYGVAALRSAEYRIRRLGVEMLGATLSKRLQGGELEAVVEMLADPDTGVAAAAERVLVQVASANPAGLEMLSSGSSAGRLLSLADESATAEVRLRVLGLASQVAVSSSEAAAAMERAGLLGSFMAELRDPSDALACAASLEILGELVQAVSSRQGADAHNAAAIGQTFAPALAPLLAWSPDSGTDPLVVGRAFHVAAALAAAAAAAGSLWEGGSAQALGAMGPLFLQASAGLLSTAALEEVEVPEELTQAVLEAVAAAGAELPGAERVAGWQAEDGSLLQLMAEACLSRKGGHGETRIVALHALGTLCGAERMDRGGSVPGDAILPAQQEAALRAAVGSAAEGVSSPHPGAAPWTEVLWALLQQPFLPLRVAAYRLGCALALRGWAAAELCSQPDLLTHVCNPGSEVGQQGSQWRYAMVRAMAAGASGPGAESLGGAAEALLKAVDAGPYGGGMGATSHEHFVASVPR